MSVSEKNTFDRRSSRHTGSVRGSYAPSHTGTLKGKLKAFALGLEVKEISVLYIKIANIESLLRAYAPNDVVSQHGRVLAELMKIVAKSKGDISYFDQCKFIVTWNASTKVKNHAVEACNAAVLITEAINKITQQLMQFHSFTKGMEITIGVATGSSLVGNIGTQSKRLFSSFGKTHEFSEALTSLSGLWHNSTVIASRTYELAKKEFNIRPIDIIDIPTGENKRIQEPVYQIVDKITKHADDEWMYEMEKEKEQNKFENCIKGFEARSRAEYATAVEWFEKHLDAHENDVIVQQLQDLCAQWRKEGQQDVVVHVLDQANWRYSTAK